MRLKCSPSTATLTIESNLMKAKSLLVIKTNDDVGISMKRRGASEILRGKITEVYSCIW